MTWFGLFLIVWFFYGVAVLILKNGEEFVVTNRMVMATFVINTLLIAGVIFVGTGHI